MRGFTEQDVPFEETEHGKDWFAMIEYLQKILNEEDPITQITYKHFEMLMFMLLRHQNNEH